MKRAILTLSLILAVAAVWPVTAQQPFGTPSQLPPLQFGASGGTASAVNGSGVASAGLVLVNGTPGVPSFAFANSLGTGVYARAAGVIDFMSATHSVTVPNVEFGNNYIEVVQGGATSSGLLFSGSTTDASAAIGAGISSPASAVLLVTSSVSTQGLRLQFGVPTIGACGAGSPAIVAGAADVRGRVTVGTGGPASCVVTFATTWTVVPECWGSVVSTTAGDARAIATSTTTTALTLTPATAFVDSSVVAFGCSGRP
jgi:hypothetical protein